MSADPVLVLQLRRMGDLILTFPLLLELGRRYQGHPLWVAADTRFFQELMPLAPQAVFFPPEHLPALAERRYAAAINLDSRVDAAACMAKLTAPLKLGPVAEGGALRVKGFWQLYRTALTRNNRHNAFHWADLHRLDVLPPGSPWPSPEARPERVREGRVGLVLGASEPAKRPDARFWARLAGRLVRSGLVPVFLGGPAERELGEEVGRLARLPQANLCGRLSLREVAAVMRGLDLCITPDTGPMHLADWLGVPVLNLSMGPVHARETGPVSPGQWVLRAAMSCVGCWSCQRHRLACKAAFSAEAVARAVHAVLDHPKDISGDAEWPGLQLLRTGRDEFGLHTLDPVGSDPSVDRLLEDFWQGAFLAFSSPAFAPLLERRAEALRETQPVLAGRLRAGVDRLLTGWTKRGGAPLPEDFWLSQPPLLRIFAGHAQMALQNEDYSRGAWRSALERAEQLHTALA
ncbi:MAG: glycosyltransferase family 9 protein [Desulfovibrio sp.]|nr:glycosyltransferase family 9 protein [Desulfovibrio sp.]